MQRMSALHPEQKNKNKKGTHKEKDIHINKWQLSDLIQPSMILQTHDDQVTSDFSVVLKNAKSITINLTLFYLEGGGKNSLPFGFFEISPKLVTKLT